MMGRAGGVGSLAVASPPTPRLPWPKVSRSRWVQCMRIVDGGESKD